MFAVIESVMNGAFTLRTSVAVIDTDAFTTAKGRLKHALINKRGFSGAVHFVEDTDQELIYTIDNGPLMVVGKLENRAVIVIEDYKI